MTTTLAQTAGDDLGPFLLEGTGALLAYAAVGLALFVAGFYMIDVIVPGRLIKVLRTYRNPNATLLVCASMVGVGLIVGVSIFAAEGDLVEGLARTAVFGLVGIVAQGLATMIFDRLVGINVRELADDAEDRLEPAAVLLAVANLMIGFVVAVAVY